MHLYQDFVDRLIEEGELSAEQKREFNVSLSYNTNCQFKTLDYSLITIFLRNLS